MSTNVTTATTARTRGRKVRALLAGGLVLGVGAAVTLAAWTDQEWATGEFGAGSFNVQGSTDGVTFTDHASSGGAANLTATLDAASNLTPEQTVAMPFVLRLDGTTTHDATVVLTDATGAGDNAVHLTYGIVQVPTVADCVVGATGTSIVPANTALTSTTGASSFTLPSGADGTAGASTTLCFQVTAGPDLIQGATGTATWGLTATSVD